MVDEDRDLVDARDVVEGMTRGADGVVDVDVKIGVGTGAGVVAVGPGNRAALIVLETPAKSDEARFWLFENLQKKGS